jgi:hypothetical protein
VIAATTLDPLAAQAVAEAHDAAPRVGGPACVAAYRQLVEETDRLFRRLGVDVVFTMSQRPYDDADELIRSVRHDRILEVTSARWEQDRRHPLMECAVGGEYDRFRAVHDVLGHGWLGVGFDRDGEYAAWRFQERFHSALAQRALATELHGEHSVRWTSGDLPEHKGALLDARVVARSRRGRLDRSRS